MVDSGGFFTTGQGFMRAALIISFLMIYYSGIAGADLSIRYDSISKKQKGPFNTFLIKQGLIRIDPPLETSHSVMIDLDSGDIVQLHAPSKRYFKVNAQTLGEYASFYQQNKSMLQGLIDQGLRQLHPQKRDRVEQIIDNYNKGSRTISQLSIQPMNKSGQVLGVDCSLFGVFNNGKLEREVCISSYQQLGLRSDDIRSLEQLKKFIQQFRQSVPREQKEVLELLSNTLAKINGLPMKIVNLYPNGKIKNIIQAASISLQSIPEQAYRIPQDYQQQTLPVL